MRKLIACLAIFCFIGITVADDCSNKLLDTFGFAKLTEPTTVSGLKYCKSLQNGKSCCSADTVNAFQDKATAMTNRLTEIVSKRDKAIVDTRDNVIPGLKSSLEKLSKNAQLATLKLNEISSSGNVGDAMIAAIFIGFANAMEQIATQASDQLPTIKSGFKDFQKARVSCVVELVKLQASAWCLACDPAYATKGVTGDTITLGDNTCNRLQSSCYNFILGSVLQSAMLSLRAVSSVIEGLATVLEKLANNNLTDLSSLSTVFAGLVPSDSSVVPVTLPNGCASNNQCNWICTSMFKSAGSVDETVIAAGGTASDPSSMFASRLLAEEEEEELVVKNKLQKRRLGSNEWNPDQDEAGVTVSFKEDPSGVGEDKRSGVLKSGFMCLVGMLIALLF